jgi:hypothetical protein
MNDLSQLKPKLVRLKLSGVLKPWNSALPRPWRKNGNTPSSS